jgi:hypothetical protein
VAFLSRLEVSAELNKGSADSSICKKVSHAFFSSLQSLLRSLSATCLLVVYLWDGLVKT